MGKRSRRRARSDGASAGDDLAAPVSAYADPEGNVLTLRGVLSPATRREYAAVVVGSPLSREDAWHRSVEFLFERLAVRWELAGLPALERQEELLARFRFASQDERAWIRETLRTHIAEHFPDLDAP